MFDCNPITDNCGPGQGCAIYAFTVAGKFATCVKSGTVPAGGACTVPTDCVSGMSCTSGVCAQPCFTTDDCADLNSVCDPTEGWTLANGTIYHVCHE
jgi:hypothetical protein